jgi:photosystem II stability/assembly factor-like uncharacterized protein
MKQKYFLFLISFLALSFFCNSKAQTTLEAQDEVVIYSNSFESPQDTVGLQEYGMIDFSSDVPGNGRTQSLYISGGCLWPHTEVEIGPFNSDGFYKVRCWGKNLQVGGSVSIAVEGEVLNSTIINVSENEWTFYESAKTLFCPAGKRIVLSMGAGGIVQSAMLVDNVEIVNVKSVQPQWVIRNGGTAERLNDVVMLDTSTAIVVGEYGSILKTTDSGETWRNTAPQIDWNCNGLDCIIEWESVVFYDSLNGVVAGESALLITSDGGEDWQFLSSPSGNNFISIGKVDLNDIYIGDDSGNIYNSRDTGKTWTSEHIADLPIRSIFLYSEPAFEGFLYALTPHSLFIKDFYATSWEEWGPLGYFYGLGGGAYKGGFSDDGTEYIVGTEGDFVAQSTIIRLRLQDSHWYSVGPANEFGELYGLSIPSSSVIYTCGSNGKVLKSTNGGNDWVSLKTPTSQALHSINFFDDERGFAVGDSGIILYTENGGIFPTNYPPSAFHLLEPANEDSMPIPRSITFKWQEAIDPNDDPVNYTFLLSSDSGATWQTYGPVTDTTSLQVQSPAQSSGRYFWTVIANDGLLATPSLDVFTFNIFSVAKVVESENVPGTFVLNQNYPNPFNPSTTIKFSIPKSSFVNLKVYDILGKEVATLVNEEKLPGEYEVEFSAKGGSASGGNAYNLSSGIYFYHMQAGSFIETRKFVLMK